MKKNEDFVSLTAANFPDHAFLVEVCRLLGAAPGDGIPSSALAKVSLLDVSNRGIHRLKGLAFFTGLRELYCSGNRLARLDITCCPELETLSCSRNVLSRLTIRGCRQLYTLVCDDNCLCSLDLTGCDALRELLCHNNMLRTLDAKAVSHLDMLWCHGNPIKLNDIVPTRESDVLPVNSAC